MVHYRSIYQVLGLWEDFKYCYWKDWCWSWSSNTLATWCAELTHLKRQSCWEISKWGWGQWTTEDEMVEWYHRLIGHEFEQAPGAGDGQAGLACCRPWGRKEPDTTERQNWTETQMLPGGCAVLPTGVPGGQARRDVLASRLWGDPGLEGCVGFEYLVRSWGGGTEGAMPGRGLRG